MVQTSPISCLLTDKSSPHFLHSPVEIFIVCSVCKAKHNSRGMQFLCRDSKPFALQFDGNRSLFAFPLAVFALLRLGSNFKV